MDRTKIKLNLEHRAMVQLTNAYCRYCRKPTVQKYLTKFLRLRRLRIERLIKLYGGDGINFNGLYDYLFPIGERHVR